MEVFDLDQEDDVTGEEFPATPEQALPALEIKSLHCQSKVPDLWSGAATAPRPPGDALKPRPRNSFSLLPVHPRLSIPTP